jgi:hypothetical protein
MEMLNVGGRLRGAGGETIMMTTAACVAEGNVLVEPPAFKSLPQILIYLSFNGLECFCSLTRRLIEVVQNQLL